MCHSSAGTRLPALTRSRRIDEHVILILKHAGSVFWRLAPACVSLRSPIQSQMASGITHPSLPCSAWPKRWWYTITDSNTHPAAISCLPPFNTSMFVSAACTMCLHKCRRWYKNPDSHAHMHLTHAAHATVHVITPTERQHWRRTDYIQWDWTDWWLCWVTDTKMVLFVVNKDQQ